MCSLLQLIEPYGGGSTPVENDIQEPKYSHKLQRSSDKVQSDVRTSSFLFEPSDDDTKDIKNIYVDSKPPPFSLFFLIYSFFPFLSLEKNWMLLKACNFGALLQPVSVPAPCCLFSRFG